MNLMGIPFNQHTNSCGVPGRSNAFISKRLEKYHRLLSTKHVDFYPKDQDLNAMISDLNKKRRRAQQDADKMRHQLELVRNLART